MAFTLPALPYAHAALEPHIDARTMEIHHGKHHQAYINNANKALEAHPALAAKSVESLISDLASVPEVHPDQRRQIGRRCHNFSTGS